MSKINGRIDFVTLIEVTHANPNGDPSNGNRPRQTDDGFGEISDVCLKRKIRNRLQDMGESIFVQSEDRSDDGITSLHERLNLKVDKAAKKDKIKVMEIANKEWLDVRAFGGVFAFKGDDLSVGIRGAVTIQPAFSISEIYTETSQITKSVNSESTSGKASDTMGEKHRVKYGLYMMKGSINARTAEKNNLTEEDAEKILKAIKTMFINDDTSARPAGSINVIKMYVFKHKNIDGQYSAYEVFNSINITENNTEVENINDYNIEIKELKDLDMIEY
jgi:CRISPR-associated protein Csd2